MFPPHRKEFGSELSRLESHHLCKWNNDTNTCRFWVENESLLPAEWQLGRCWALKIYGALLLKARFTHTHTHTHTHAHTPLFLSLVGIQHCPTLISLKLSDYIMGSSMLVPRPYSGLPVQGPHKYRKTRKYTRIQAHTPFTVSDGCVECSSLFAVIKETKWYFKKRSSKVLVSQSPFMSQSI